MAYPNSARRSRSGQLDHSEFYETLAPQSAMAGRMDDAAAYASGTRVSSPVERAVELAAAVLNLLLTLRFGLALLTSNVGNPFVAALFGFTNWLVAPFQSRFWPPPSNGSGFFDLPALAAMVVVWVVAWSINLVARAED